MRIYQNSVAKRHYYQPTFGIIESAIGEFGFYQSPRDMNPILFRVRKIWWEFIEIQSAADTTISSQVVYSSLK